MQADALSKKFYTDLRTVVDWSGLAAHIMGDEQADEQAANTSRETVPVRVRPELTFIVNRQKNPSSFGTAAEFCEPAWIDYNRRIVEEVPQSWDLLPLFRA